MHDEPERGARDLVSARAAELASAGRLSEAIAAVSSTADRQAALARFSALTKFLYTTQRDVGSMLAVAEAAAAFLETSSPGPPAEDTSLASAMMKFEYNVAANCWPGWGDEGIVLTRDQIERGLQLARHSLLLCQSMEPDHERLGNGHWLVGALSFALGALGDAANSFAAGGSAFDSAHKQSQALMARGYGALVDARMPLSRERAKRAFADIVAALESLGDEDSLFFVEQMRVADKILG